MHINSPKIQLSALYHIPFLALAYLYKISPSKLLNLHEYNFLLLLEISYLSWYYQVGISIFAYGTQNVMIFWGWCVCSELSISIKILCYWGLKQFTIEVMQLVWGLHMIASVILVLDVWLWWLMWKDDAQFSQTSVLLLIYDAYIIA